jgi:polysaccharide export outer membrane protein
MRHLDLCLLVLVLLWGPAEVCSQTDPNVPRNTTAPALTNRQEREQYRIHLSDKLEIQLPFSPEYNEMVTVQPDGRISVREAEPVMVLGKTLPEAEALIAVAYNGVLSKPVVSVLLKDFLKPSFYASGEVGHPGRYEILSDITLLQAISEAGGLVNERARKKQIVVFRPLGNGTYESKVIDIKQMLDAKGPAEDYAILPGDVIYVPQNRTSKIQRFLPTSSIGTYVGPGSL